MSWINTKLKKMYERKKEMLLFQDKSVNWEDLSSEYLDGETFENITKNERIAYMRGILRGIHYVDSMMTPVTLDPLESPETRFEIVPKYVVERKNGQDIFDKIEDITSYNENKVVIGWSIVDNLTKQVYNEGEVSFLRKEAEKVREELIRKCKGGN